MGRGRLPAMSRTLRLGLGALALFLLAFPLTLDKPGWPPSLKADEPAYYLMARSLAEDGDLELGVEDVDRVFEEFPFRPVDNLILMTTDGWRTVYYGKPYVYSLFAAPFAALAGANGLLFFNMLLTVAMIAMGTEYLARYNPAGQAALFATGFFLLSAGFAYVFWLQPEVFNMFSVAACLWLGFSRLEVSRHGLWLAALSGAVLSLGVYNKPMLAALGVPVLWALLARRRLRQAGAWLAGAVIALAAVAGGSVGLTGEPTSYLGVVRQGVTLCEPGVMPIEPEPAAAVGEPDPERPTGGAWSWIFRVPEVAPRALAENLTYFLLGRHTGLFVYFPFSLLALVLFAAHARRSGRRWVLLAMLAVVALFFLVFIPANWQGGGGFIGNRYFVNAYPGFLFLVTRLTPRLLTLAGYALGGLFLGPLLLSPFARTGPEPTLQSHVRNAPFELLPLELSLREVPGYHRVDVGSHGLVGRKDVVLPRGERLWIRGASRVELLLVGTEPVARGAWLVETPAPRNSISFEMGEARRTVELGAATPAGPRTRLILEPGGPDKVRLHAGQEVFVHRLLITAQTGRVRSWTRQMPPQRCEYFAYNASFEESFFVGAALTWLGEAEQLERDVFGVAWRRVKVPERVTAGSTFTVPVVLVNASEQPWTAGGAARVKLGYRWIDAAGERLGPDAPRTELELPVPPGRATRVPLEVTAPQGAGSYQLVIDPVFEHVAWFSQRGAAPWEGSVVVDAAPVADSSAGAP